MQDEIYFQELRQIGPRPVWQITPPANRPVHTADELATGGPQATPAGGYPLTDHGGSTLKQPKLVLVYLGQFWGDTAKLEAFAADLMTAGYLAPLSAYGSGQGTYVGAFQGDPVSGTVQDAQLQAALGALIGAGHVPAPDANTLYALILPDGVTVDQGGAASCSAFCGYHDAFTLPDGRQVYYTVQPSTNCGGCNEGDAFDGFTAVLAHEVAEACTDAIPGEGWYNDQTGMENADEWAWPEPFHRYGPWAVQGYQVNGVGDDFGPYQQQPQPNPNPNPDPQPQPQPQCRTLVDGAFEVLLAAIGNGSDPWSAAGRIWLTWAQQYLDQAVAGQATATSPSLPPAPSPLEDRLRAALEELRDAALSDAGHIRAIIARALEG